MEEERKKGFEGMTPLSPKLTPSQEDYLEAILALIRDQRVARVRDIAKRLEVGKSAVTAAVKSLARRELVNYDPYQYITLTDRGRRVAEKIDNRHVALQCFFETVLGLSESTAAANACRMEHNIDDEAFERLQQLAAFMAAADGDGRRPLEAFRTFLHLPRPAADKRVDRDEGEG